MLELLLCCAVGVGVARAARARHPLALPLGVAIAYLLVADILGALATQQEPQQLFSFFNVLFLGPGVAATRGDSALPLPAALIESPLLTRIARALLSWTLAFRCLRESSQLNPLLPRAYALDGIAMPFVGAGVLEALEFVILVLAQTLAARM